MSLAVSIGHLETATGLIGTLDFCLDHVINLRYLYVTGFTKPTKLTLELKSKLKPTINDTLMHCQETSTIVHGYR